MMGLHITEFKHLMFGIKITTGAKAPLNKSIMKHNRHEEEMRYYKITADIQRKVAEFKPKKQLKLSHTVTPFMVGNKWKASTTDHKPELKRRFH